MLDYHGDRVALAELETALAGSAFPDPDVSAARDRDLAAAGAQQGSALLGSFVHHLVAHASSDGVELDLMERAATLWATGVDLCTRLGDIRRDLEGALEDPTAPGAPARFDAAAFEAQVLGNEAIALQHEADAIRTEAITFPHLPPHPRQADSKTDQWGWGELLAGRRTEAFVRTLYRRIDDTRTNAMAFGAAAAYGANVVGSAYVAHAVGGPRRSHRFRDRVARNSFGAWLAGTHPAAMRPTDMADTIAAEIGATLPAQVEAFVLDALGGTYDLDRTQPLPDLPTGYDRLLRHLRVLDAFEMPPPPAPPGQVWMAKLYADPQNPPPSLRPQDIDVVGQDGGGVGVQYGSPSASSSNPNSSDSTDANTVCGIIAAVLIVIDVVQAFIQCIVQWADGDTCTFWDNMLLKKLWEQDPPDPRDPTHVSTDEQGLTAMAGLPQTVQFIGMLSDAHQTAWEALDRAYNFLAALGFIYPKGLLGAPLYAQFTSLPGSQVWPRREELQPVAAYHRYPSSAVEDPVESPSPFAVGSAPSVYVTAPAASTATAVSLTLWGQIAFGVQDSQNLDLDADRGFGHPCWAAAGSVHDAPIAVVGLGFDEQ